MGRWIRTAHLKEKPLVAVGTYVAPFTQIGYCGISGRVTGPHVHLDGTKAKPKSWWQYHNRPFSEYFDTGEFARFVLPYPKRFITLKHGQFWGSSRHIGVDVNVAPEDLGLPVFSPVYGWVRYVEPPITAYRVVNGIKSFFNKTWGGGFGNFLWIEIDESRYE